MKAFSSENFGFSPPYAIMAGIGPWSNFVQFSNMFRYSVKAVEDEELLPHFAPFSNCAFIVRTQSKRILLVYMLKSI